MSVALTPLQALVALHGECEKSLDFRPSLRRTMAEAYTAIVNAPMTNREPLEGMLVLDIGTPIETDESFALSISEVMLRTAPAAIGNFLREVA